MFTEREKKVFFATELDAELTAQAVAQKTRLKTGSVQRILSRLIERGVISGRTAVVDIARLGLSEFGIRLQIEFKSRGHRESFEKMVSARSEIGWLAATGGSYSYSINIIAESPHEALNIFQSVCDSSSGEIVRQDLCIRTERYRFWGNGESNSHAGRLRYHLGKLPGKIALTKNETAILQALNQSTLMSFRDLAQRTQIPLATVLRTIKHLKSSGILLGFAYRLDRRKVGLTQHRIYLRTRSRGKKMTNRLLKILESMNTSRLLTICLGAWDYELAFDLEPEASIRDCVETLRDGMGEEIRELEVAPVYQQIKVISFPIMPSRI